MRASRLAAALLIAAAPAGAAAAGASHGVTAAFRWVRTSEDPCGSQARLLPACTAALDASAEAALGNAMRLTFLPPPPLAQPDLTFLFTAREVDLGGGFTGGRVFVAIDGVVEAAPGAGPLGHITLRGSSQLLSDSTEALRNALDRAVADAASQLSPAVDESEPIARWLAARGKEVAGSTVFWPERGRLLAFLDLGAGGSFSDEVGGGAVVRAGLSGAWFAIQGVLGVWSFAEGSVPGRTTKTAGIELGPAYRIGRNFEARAGAGLSANWGTASFNGGSADYSRWTPTLFAAFQYALWLPSFGRERPARLRFGLEVRKPLDAGAPLSKLREIVPVAGAFVGAYVGIELAL